MAHKCTPKEIPISLAVLQLLTGESFY
jgi:hypothetical protein